MDRVRFGRALGYGARHAVKSLTEAVDAAVSANPEAGRPSVAQRVTQAQTTVRQAKVQGKKAGRSVWSPLAKFSRVLWLQVTGTFFALIAAYLSQGLWKGRGVLGAAGNGGLGAYCLHGAAFAVFAYFAVSSFVRARQREKR